MPVFKTYFKILKKQLTSIILYGVMFLAITIAITFSAMKQDNTQYTTRKVPIIVINNDGENEFLDGFMQYLENYVKFADIEQDEDAMRDALFYRKVSYILTIPQGFTDSFLHGGDLSLNKQIVPDGAAPLSVDTAIDNYLNTANLYLKHNPDLSYNTLASYLKENLSQETTVFIDKAEKEISKNLFNMNFYNYLGYILITCFILGISNVMVAFNKKDIVRRQHASPMSVRGLNIRLIIANFAFAMCYLFVFLLAGYLLNNPSNGIDTSTLLHWLNATIFSLIALSISYLVGITMKSKQAVAALSSSVALSLAFISGIMVPQNVLGDAVLRVASFTPTYWYVKANNTIVDLTNFAWENLTDIFSYMAIQVGFAVALISIALVVSKRKSQQAG